ncbi:hypothetical protein Drose_36050 [Dactylosporangium roseum]|uniref:Uncharacterized protein n=1 Tax=Dactylosporangium roseum TaxID=47989 RepID=A0ABY5Z5Q9_9ACTN|nr:hypothetical protein [Dactylosporangium roseum]UWZ36388.1 hypothetical protein Drose_36050 [Dactylosporangium roseum]
MDLLTDAIATLDERGVLTPLADLIRQVYRRAAERHEPALGDDAMSFGTTVWRNLTNLGAAQFDGQPGVDARIEDNSLEILAAGYILRLYSLQGGTDSSVESIRWEGSEARLGGAVENSADGQLAFDDDEQFPDAFAGLVPRKRHIRVAHAGDIDTGEAVAYLGLPRDNRTGGSPWFEVALWFGTPARPATGPADPASERTQPRHDELTIPDIELQLRRASRSAGASMSA